jgi:hypothetical protein
MSHTCRHNPEAAHLSPPAGASPSGPMRQRSSPGRATSRPQLLPHRWLPPSALGCRYWLVNVESSRWARNR